jgi:hypothetical protein
MAHLDLAAPSAAILPKLRFSCLFADLQAQPQPVAEIVPNSQPHENRPVFQSFTTQGVPLGEVVVRVSGDPSRFEPCAAFIGELDSGSPRRKTA